MINLIKNNNSGQGIGMLSPEDNREKRSHGMGLDFHDLFRNTLTRQEPQENRFNEMDQTRQVNDSGLAFQNDRGEVKLQNFSDREEIRDLHKSARSEGLETETKQVKQEPKKSETGAGRDNSTVEGSRSEKDKSEMVKKSLNEKETKINEEDLIKQMKGKKTSLKDLISELESLVKNKKKIETKDIDLLIKGTNTLIEHIKTAKDKLKINDDTAKQLHDARDLLLKHREGRGRNMLEQGIKNLKAAVENLDLKNIASRGIPMETMHAFKDTLLNILGKYSGKKGEKDSATAEKGQGIKTDLQETKIENSTVKILDSSKNETLRHFDTSGRNDAGEGFGLNVQKNQGGAHTAASGQADKNIQFRQQLQEMLDNSKITIKDGKNATFSVKLYPKELGSLNINIGLEHGVLNGKFLVDNAASRDLLLQNLSYIKEQLENAGIQLGEFQVNINNQGERYGKEEREQSAPALLADNEIKMASEYSQNLMAYHNYEINMII